MKKIFDDKLYGNATYLMATTVINSALGFVFWYIVARCYTVDEVGLASTIITSMMFLATFSLLGFDLGFLRFLPQAGDGRSNRMINSCLTLSGTVAIVFSIIFLIGLPFWAPKLVPVLWGNIFFIFLFILFTLLWLLGMLVDAVFVAKRTAEYVLIRNLVFSILKLLIVFFAVALGAFGIFFSWGISALIAFIVVLLYFLPRLGHRPGFSIDRTVIGHIFKFSLGNYVANFLGYSAILLLPLMITEVLSPEMAAYFYISWMIASILFMVPVGISSSLLAEVSTNEDKFRENLKKAIKFTYLLVIPGVILLYILSDELLLLFDEGYVVNALSVLRIFTLSTFFYAANVIYITVKNIQKKVKTVIAVNAVIAFFTLSLSYLLLGRIGLEGVALAWLFSQASVTVIISLTIIFRRYVKPDSSN